MSVAKVCSAHGGLLIYLNNDYKHKILNVYNTSDIWEGQFIEVLGSTLQRKL